MKKIVLVIGGLLLCAICAAQMSPAVRSVPNEIMKNVFTKSDKYLPQLVSYLTSRASGDSEKVKVIHDWICDNIAYDTAVFDGKEGIYEVKQVLKTRRAVCSGYTNLMIKMCTLAKIECFGVQGWSKGHNFNGTVSNDIDHDWNVVKIGGKLQQVDATWDAGFCDNKVFVKHYTTDYLHLTPAQFIYTHFPEKSEYQYLPKPITKDEFIDFPYFNGAFFSMGFAKRDAKTDKFALAKYTNKIDGVASFTFNAPKKSVKVSSFLLGKDERSVLDNYCLVQRAGSVVTCAADVPDKATYIVELSACDANSVAPPIYIDNSDYQKAADQVEYLLQSKKITAKEKEIFEGAYLFSRENNRYYYQEDLFNQQQIKTALKILKMLEMNTEPFTRIANFFVQAGGEYGGSGGAMSFPNFFADFAACTNTQIKSPLKGVLKKGEAAHFEVASGDFANFGIVIDGNLVPFKKNGGVFSLDYTVPDNTDNINIFASKDGRNYKGLFSYNVE